MPKAEYTGQGKLLWNLICEAGWNKYRKLTAAEKKQYGDQKRYKRYELWLMFRYKVTHINALTPAQMGGAIATMKTYAEKENKRAAEDKKKTMRKQIVSAVIKSKQTVAWLHEQMVMWGYGESLRALDTPQLCELAGTLAKSLGRVV